MRTHLSIPSLPVPGKRLLLAGVFAVCTLVLAGTLFFGKISRAALSRQVFASINSKREFVAEEVSEKAQDQTETGKPCAAGYSAVDRRAESLAEQVGATGVGESSQFFTFIMTVQPLLLHQLLSAAPSLAP